MSEQLEQNKQPANMVMTPMLDHILPRPVQQSEGIRAEFVGVDMNDPEAGRRAELGAVRAMILRQAADLVEVMVFRDLGRIDDDVCTGMKRQFEEKIKLQLESVDLCEGGLVYAPDGEQFDIFQLAAEALEATYPEVEPKVLKRERETLLDQVDDINQRLQRYESPLTVEHLLPTKSLEYNNEHEEVSPGVDEFTPEYSDKAELHTGIGRRILELVKH